MPPVAGALTAIEAPVARYHVGFSGVRSVRNNIYSVSQAMRPSVVGLDAGSFREPLLRAKDQAVVTHRTRINEERNDSLPDRIIRPG